MADASNEVDAGQVPALEGGELAQGEVARLRGRLLGGRGPGASPTETAKYMHQRATVGAVPTVIEREAVQIRADAASGNADAIAADMQRVREQLAGTLAEITARTAPRRLATQALAAARARCAVLLGAPEPDPTVPSANEASSGIERPRRFGRGPDEWWWRVAVRGAAFGAAVTLGCELIARVVGAKRARRLSGRRAGRSGRLDHTRR